MKTAYINKERNITEGPLLKRIILFVLPLMATNLLQTFYNSADMMIVSLSDEKNSVGAIGATGAMINLVLNIFIGLSIGANVVVARHIGEGDQKKTTRAVHTSLLVGAILGVVGMIVGLIVSRPALAAMGAEENLLELATLYTAVYFVGVPCISLTNFAISVFRAKGDTKTPLFVLTGSGLLNVLLNLFFVLVTKMSVDGVALATALSNIISAVILLALMHRDKGACGFRFRSLGIDGAELKEIIHVGVPSSIQGALFSISNILIQSSILKVNNALVPAGETFEPIVNGNAAAGNLEAFAYSATNSVHQAAVTFTSQHVGAKKYKRIYRVIGLCYALTFVIATVSAGIILAFRDPFLSLYGIVNGEAGSLDALAYDAALSHMLYMETTYFTCAFMEVGSGILRGLGKSVTSAAITLAGSCVFRIIWIYTVFESVGTLGSIFVSYPISWTLTAAVSFVFCIVVLSRMIRRSKGDTYTEVAA